MSIDTRLSTPLVSSSPSPSFDCQKEVSCAVVVVGVVRRLCRCFASYQLIAKRRSLSSSVVASNSLPRTSSHCRKTLKRVRSFVVRRSIVRLFVRSFVAFPPKSSFSSDRCTVHSSTSSSIFLFVVNSISFLDAPTSNFGNFNFFRRSQRRISHFRRPQRRIAAILDVLRRCASIF